MVSTKTMASSSGIAPTTRYLLMPSLSLSAAQKQDFFEAHLIGRQNITTDTLSDGTIDSWAVPLSDPDADSFKPLMQGFGYIMPQVIGFDDGDSIGNNSNSTTQAQPIRRSHLETEKESYGTLDLKTLGTRQAPGRWESEQRVWDMAIVSQPQGYPVPYWNPHLTYRYVRKTAVEPGEGSRVYVIDSGIDLRHPEFASRARVDGSTDPDDYDVEWIFADHDPREALWDMYGYQSSYTTSWLDPDDPDGPHHPQTGFPLAYTDFSGHGTQVSSLIFGDNLGIARAADVTVVKLVVYTSGRLQGKSTLYSIRSAFRKVYQDIATRKSNGETKFVISMSVGAEPGNFPYPGSRETFLAVCTEFMQAFQRLDVSVVVSAGNGADISVRTPQNCTIQRTKLVIEFSKHH